MDEMTLEEKLERSKSEERIDFSQYQSTQNEDPLVKVTSTKKLLVAPNWTIPGDFEGGMYADYIAEHPEYDGIWVRPELLKRLKTAADSLADPYQLVIRAGHRPIAVQKRLLRECAEEFKTDHPNDSDAEALEHARTFVSDPEIQIPPHVCGAAVDVELLNVATGKYLGFGSAMNENNESSFLHYPDLTPEQKANRLMLLTAMLDAGLASDMFEWWHFSYGDQIWAWFYGQQYSLYSPVDL